VPAIVTLGQIQHQRASLTPRVMNIGDSGYSSHTLQKKQTSIKKDQITSGAAIKAVTHWQEQTICKNKHQIAMGHRPPSKNDHKE
jgi:hypothetical protein